MGALANIGPPLSSGSVQIFVRIKLSHYQIKAPSEMEVVLCHTLLTLRVGESVESALSALAAIFFGS